MFIELLAFSALLAGSAQAGSVPAAPREVFLSPGIAGEDSLLTLKLQEILIHEAGRSRRIKVTTQSDLSAKGIEFPGNAYSGRESIQDSLKSSGLAQDIIWIHVQGFYQKGVPREDIENEEKEVRGGFWKKLIIESAVSILSQENRDEPFADNIQTRLEVELERVNLSSGQTSHETILCEHTGGRWKNSLHMALKIFSSHASLAIARLYGSESAIVKRGNDIRLEVYEEQGALPGQLYVISSRAGKETLNGIVHTNTVKSRALMRLEDVGENGSMGRVVRQWSEIQAGDRAMECPQPGPFHSTSALVLESTPRKPFGLFLVNGYLLLKPFDHFHYGFGMRLGFMEDGRGEADIFIGFGFPIAWTLLQMRGWKVDAMTSLDADIPGTNDDAGDFSNTFVPGLVPSLQIQRLVSRKFDIVFGLGYRFFGRNTSWWVASDGGSTRPANWNNGSPVIDTRGWMANVGFRFFNF